VTPAPWTVVDGKLRCERHRTVFGPLETCAGCTTDPGPAISADEHDEDIPEPPEGCVSANEHERRFTKLADDAEKLAGKQKKSAATAAKLLGEAIKARRAASALARAREELELVKQLDRRKSSMRGRH
jgi:hypothetical protein